MCLVVEVLAREIETFRNSSTELDYDDKWQQVKALIELPTNENFLKFFLQVFLFELYLFSLVFKNSLAQNIIDLSKNMKIIWNSYQVYADYFYA